MAYYDPLKLRIVCRDPDAERRRISQRLVEQASRRDSVYFCRRCGGETDPSDMCYYRSGKTYRWICTRCYDILNVPSTTSCKENDT